MVTKSIKNIVILSDTHGFIHPEIIRLVAQSDIAIHAGDVCEESTLSALKPLEKLIAIAGNNDTHITNLDNIATLDLYGQQIVIEHGHLHGHIQPSHDSLRQTYPKAKIIIYGHTHQQVLDKSQTPWVINPGAAGKIRTNGGASCLLLTASQSSIWSIKAVKFND